VVNNSRPERRKTGGRGGGIQNSRSRGTKEIAVMEQGRDRGWQVYKWMEAEKGGYERRVVIAAKQNGKARGDGIYTGGGTGIGKEGGNTRTSPTTRRPAY